LIPGNPGSIIALLSNSDRTGEEAGMTRNIRVLVATLIALAITLCQVSAGPAAEVSEDLVERGKTALESGRAAEAVDLFSRLIAVEPRGDFYYHRALGYSMGHEEGLAIEDFTKAIALEPDQPAYYLERGISLLENGRPEDAVADLTKVLKLDPQNRHAWAKLALAYTSLGRIQEAFDAVNDAIRLDPEAADLFRLRGDIYSSAEDFKAAVRDYTQAVELRPHNPVAYNNRGVALARLGRNREAVKDLEAAMEQALSSPSSVRIPGISGNAW
jgi:tetratricopeptide (TPR) repeat protein